MSIASSRGARLIPPCSAASEEGLAAKKIHCKEFDGGDGNAGSIRVVQRGASDKEPTIYRMLINRNHAVSVRFVTLAHELAHLFLGHLGADKALSVPRRQPLTYAEQELEAESVAYVVAERSGVKSKSKTYLASFVKRETTIDDLDAYQVMRAAGQVETILGLISPTRFEPPRPRMAARSAVTSDAAAGVQTDLAGLAVVQGGMPGDCWSLL